MVRTLDGLLRARSDALERLTPLTAAAILIVFGGIYGAVMGSFGGQSDPRLLQMLYSAIKVPILVGVTGAIGLPVFFMFATLLGLREDLGQSMRFLLATQAILAMLLASFAPFTWLWYASSADYSAALLFNGAMFGFASLFAQRVLNRLFRPLVEKDPRHKTLIRIWLVTYAFVGIQMGWLLRPFVGNPHEPTTFFRTDAWGNAYEVVAQNIRNVLGL